MLKVLWIGGLSLTLLLSQGISHSEAKGQATKKHVKKITVVDKNKDGIPDKWETKYKLGLTKDIWKKDQDKDGLNNLIEYKLKLNPDSADTDHDGIKDGDEDSDGDSLSNKTELSLKLNPGDADSDHDKIKDSDEDFDKDGLSNLSEVELNLNPANADSDHDKVKDGAEDIDKDGIKQVNEVRSFKLKVQTGHKKEIEIEYKKHNGTDFFKIDDKTGKITQDMATVLVNDLHSSPSLKSDYIINVVKSVFQLDDSFKLDLEIKYFSGIEVEVDKEVKQDQLDDNNDESQQTSVIPADDSEQEHN